MFKVCFYVRSDNQHQIFHNVVKMYDLFDRYCIICGYKQNRHIYYVDYDNYKLKWIMIDEMS